MLHRPEESETFQKLRETGRKFSAVSVPTHASSIAYYTFLSVVPLLAICISLVSLVGFGRQEVLDFISPFLPETFQDLVTSLIKDAYNVGGLAFSVSSLSLLWTASKGAKALRAGLNSAYGEQESRSAVGVVVISILSVIVMGILIAIQVWLVFGDSLLSVVSQFISDTIPQEWFTSAVSLVTSLGFGSLLLDLCYTFLPNGKRLMLRQVPGAMFAMAGIHVLSWAFHVYVVHFGNYSVLYGSLATVALFLFWMYIVFYIMITGAFLNRWLSDRAEGDAEKSERPGRAFRQRMVRDE